MLGSGQEAEEVDVRRLTGQEVGMSAGRPSQGIPFVIC